MSQNGQSSLTLEEPLGSRLKAVVEQAAKSTDASYAFLLLSNEDASKLHNVTWYGQEGAAGSCAAITQLVLSRGEALCLKGEADTREILGCSLDRGVMPLICVPVISSNAICYGVLTAGCPRSTDKDFAGWLPFLESLAQLVGAFFEIESLQTELQDKEQRLSELIKDTFDAQEAERERICLEVHDGVTQTLASAFQYLQTMETTPLETTHAKQLLLRASTLVKQAIQESREVINSLQPATLRDVGLVATLREEIQRIEQETRWKIDFKADAIRLPEDVETGLYRIIHEAITNARKHAATKRLRIRITSADDQVKAEVRDWGVGFNYDSRDMSQRRVTGLLSMRKRAELLQGTCNIQSILGQGTVVNVEIPFSGYKE